MDLTKIRRAIIGTQGAQTEPWVLRELAKLGSSRERLRVIFSSTGTFHPKLIVGRRGREMRAIVGSANLTCAGYGSNVELNVQLDGEAAEPDFRKIEAFLDEHWSRGCELEDDWLMRYTLAWEAATRRSGAVVPQSRLELTAPSSLDLEWAEYVAWIYAQENRRLSSGERISVRGPFPSYYGELDRARAVFARGVRFADVPYVDRQLLMGVGSSSSGLIGSMKPAGYARGIINTRPEQIGEDLDRLPVSGPVSLALAADIVEAMTRHKGVKIGVASRLLTVKRPDLFVSVNNGSNPSLAVLLQGRPVKTAKHYIALLKIVWNTPWYRSAPPKDREEKQLWERRAAMLDAALFESVPKP